MTSFNYHSIWLVTLISTSLLSTSCWSPRMPKNLNTNFTFKYTPGISGLDSLVKLNGYFTQIESEPDTFYMNYLFFNDGIVIKNMVGYDKSIPVEDNERVNKSPNQLSNHLYEMTRDTNNNLIIWGIWGTYRVSSDTIKTQSVYQGTNLNDGWYGWEEHFYILDDTTLVQTAIKPLHYNANPLDQKLLADKVKMKKPLRFIPAKAVPNSDCWLKDESWFWKNENDFLNYKKKKTVANNG